MVIKFQKIKPMMNFERKYVCKIVIIHLNYKSFDQIFNFKKLHKNPKNKK